MKALLDTNILIHREASRVINEEIGVLFNWLDRLGYEKCIHPLSISELEKHKNADVVRSISAKIKSYHTLRTQAPDSPLVELIRKKYDSTENDHIDTSLLNELNSGRVDCLITEDRKIHEKAAELGISDSVFTIDGFLEKATSENPRLADYKVLSVKKEYFGNINIHDPFFNSFREDYEGFDGWFLKKSDDEAYVCNSETGAVVAFLYIKKEEEGEDYSDIEPGFEKKKRMKIGTLKVVSNGFKLGERFLKIIFDNALENKVDEIYVTLFDTREEHDRLIWLLETWGFTYHGSKTSNSGVENVYVKDLKSEPDISNPKRTYPFISRNSRKFIVPIYPEYHTELLPDSILNTESPDDFVESEPHRNAIQKVYVSRSIERSLAPGDLVLFYRTGGYHRSVVTTIGVVDSVVDGIQSEEEFIRFCRKRSVFTDNQLREHWNYNARSRPFVVNFLYVYSFPRRPNLNELIELGVIADVRSAPRGFVEISQGKFDTILRASNSNEDFIVD